MAGKASRFGGIAKELVRINDKTLLEHHLTRVNRNTDTAVFVLNYVNNFDVRWFAVQQQCINLNIKYRIALQDTKHVELLGAIQVAVNNVHEQTDHYWLVLPDSVFDPVVELLDTDITFYCVPVDDPTKLSTLTTDDEGVWHIHTKSVEGGSIAWGSIRWNQRVMDYVKQNMYKYSTYDELFEDLANKFTVGIHMMDYYYDIGSQESYNIAVRELKW
jgi:NDP-sugar pyrophosphorylase family protein